MDMTEKQLSSEYKFRGRIMTARVDEVSLPNGKTAPREVCEHVGGVGVLPIDMSVRNKKQPPAERPQTEAQWQRFGFGKEEQGSGHFVPRE